MLRHPLTDTIVNLRSAGLSYSEIVKKTGVAKSSVHQIIKRENIQLTDEQKKRLDRKELDNRNKFGRWSAAGLKKGMKQRMKTPNVINYSESDMFLYNELVKEFGEGTTFTKQKLHGYIFDFVNDTCIIDYGAPQAKITNIIKKFAKLREMGEERTCVFLGNMDPVGEVRKARFAELNVECVHLILDDEQEGETNEH